MSTQVTVTLPDEMYRRVEHLARLTGRDIEATLAEAIQLSLHPLGLQPTPGRPVADLSDGEVMQEAEAQMDPVQDRYLSELLDRQQAGQLTEEDRAALAVLLGAYQDGLLRKAQALHQAVQRGLRPPLDP